MKWRCLRCRPFTLGSHSRTHPWLRTWLENDFHLHTTRLFQFSILSGFAAFFFQNPYLLMTGVLPTVKARFQGLSLICISVPAATTCFLFEFLCGFSSFLYSFFLVLYFHLSIQSVPPPLPHFVSLIIRSYYKSHPRSLVIVSQWVHASQAPMKIQNETAHFIEKQRNNSKKCVTFTTSDHPCRARWLH